MLDWFHRKRLEKRRRSALSSITGEQVSVDAMAQRPRKAEDVLDAALLDNIRQRLAEIIEKAKQATNIDDLDDLADDAEVQGELRAYICPIAEISDEGKLALEIMEEWNLPNSVTANLRGSLIPKLEQADRNPEIARGALRALFREYDSWATYTEDYEDTMQSHTHWLFVATIALIILAMLMFNYQTAFLAGLLFAGAAGSCVSIMAKMPLLIVSQSGELAAYTRRILTRIGIGMVASLIGCALLAWGFISFSIQGQSFADLLTNCAASTTCTPLRRLILLGIPMLFGFSERALTSFEERVFPNSKSAE